MTLRNLAHMAGERRSLAVRGALLGLAAGTTLALGSLAFAQDAARVAEGEAVWNKGDCASCHGASGAGGLGGGTPVGPSLRKTKLDRAALKDTISCGRPGAEMPSFLRRAYVETPCFGLPAGPAPERTRLIPVLTAGEIDALLDYLMAKIVGK